jgi:hypothetical protein
VRDSLLQKNNIRKQEKMMNETTKLVVALTVVSLSLIVVTQSASGQSTIISKTTPALPKLYIATTRNFTNTNNTFSLDTAQLINSALSKFGGGCPREIAIYIHGFNRDQNEAGEEFDRIHKSLNYNNYTEPLIGFSWNSNTGYERAKNNAQDNGPQLAKFIIAFKSKCPNVNIRVIGHSLGAAVVESTLVNLDKSQQDLNTSGNNSKIIKSVDLLGAAINNKSISKNTDFGKAIEHVVDKFYNLYDSQDNGLEYNILFENHIPLGLIGVSLKNATLNYHPLGLEGVSLDNRPVNYIETNVTKEIPAISDADGDGNVEECFENIMPVIVEGDNHCGYIGFRQPFSPSLISDGAMNVVVRGWNNP